MEFNPIRVAFQNWSIGRSLRSCCGNGLHILVWKNQTTPAIHTFWQHGTCITSWKPILLQMIFTWDARGLIHRVLCQTMLPASLCRKRLGGLDAQECELCNMTLDASIWTDIVIQRNHNKTNWVRLARLSPRNCSPKHICTICNMHPICVLNHNYNLNRCRPYRVECTRSPSTSEV